MYLTYSYLMRQVGYAPVSEFLEATGEKRENSSSASSLIVGY